MREELVYVIVVDRSKSMCERIWDIRKLDAAREAAEALIDSIVERSEVARVAIAAIPHRLGYKHAEILSVLTIDKFSKSLAYEELARIRDCLPTTPLFKGLEEVAREASREGKPVIFYIGDAVSTEFIKPGEIERIASSIETPVYAIVIGRVVPPRALSFFTRLSRVAPLFIPPIIARRRELVRDRVRDWFETVVGSLSMGEEYTSRA